MPNPNILKLAVLDGRPEIFHSIQGEGKSVGRPSVFVRTSLCNLHCIWCDTDYTWNWEGTPFVHLKDNMAGYAKYDKKQCLVSCPVEHVARMIRQYPCRNVILTGGEPMMQQTALTRLMQTLQTHETTFHFEVETNGTLAPTEGFEAAIHQYNVSPKLSNSNNPQKLRERPRALHAFADNPKANFKFVLTHPDDLTEIRYLAERYHIAPERLWLMPEGTTPQQLDERRLWLTDICKQYGFYYSDRLHVQIWGDKKGV